MSRPATGPICSSIQWVLGFILWKQYLTVMGHYESINFKELVCKVINYFKHEADAICIYTYISVPLVSVHVS
jgi:hypothetical protein